MQSGTILGAVVCFIWSLPCYPSGGMAFYTAFFNDPKIMIEIGWHLCSFWNNLSKENRNEKFCIHFLNPPRLLRRRDEFSWNPVVEPFLACGFSRKTFPFWFVPQRPQKLPKGASWLCTGPQFVGNTVDARKQVLLFVFLSLGQECWKWDAILF